METVIGRGVIPVSLERRGLDSQVGKVGSSVGSKFKKIGAVAGKALIAGAAAVVTGGAIFLKGAIEEASDFNEVISKSAQIFGKSAVPALQKFADGAATSLGQSKTQALDAASTFGVFGKSAGLAGKDLVGFSTEMVTLASDMASFNNTTPEEAIEALGAALRGESEPIRRYGVLLDDATLKARAMKMGIYEGTGALTPQQKVLAAHQEILAQTTDQQGDFARTSGGLANQQRILAARFKNLQGEIGQRLLPVAVKLANWANDSLLPALEKIAGNLADVLGPAFQKLGPIVRKAWDTLTGIFSGGDGGNNWFGELKKTFDAIVSYIGGLLPTVMKTGRDLFNAIGPAIQQIGRLFTEVLFPAFRGVLPIIQPVAKFILSVLGSAIVGAIRGATQALSGIIDVITGVFKLVKALVTGDWKGAWTAAKQIVTGIFDAIVGAIKVWFNVGILGVFKQGIKALIKSWKGLWENVKATSTKAWNSVKAFLDKTWKAIGKIFEVAWKRVLKPVFEAIIKFLGGALRKAFNAYKAYVTTVWNAVRNVISKVWGGIRGIWQTIIRFLNTTFRNAFNAFRNLVSTIWNAVRSRIASVWNNGIRPIFNRIRDFVVNTFRNAFNTFRNTVSNIWGSVRQRISSVWNNGIRPVFNRLSDFIRNTVPNAFRRGITAIGNIWNRLKSLAAKPVRFVVNTVYMDGIRRVVNAIPGVPDLPAVRFAKGGEVTGGVPGKDSVRAWLMPGEHVLTTEEVKKLGGQSAVYAMRKSIQRGEFGNLGDVGAPRFAAGGALTPEQILRAQAWAKSQVGKPYVWGGVGPGGYDCSGFMSAITNVILGRNPYSRLGATATFPWSGFRPGYGQFTIGSSKQYPGSGVGHMAGTLGGLNVESAGGVGVRVGGSARGAGDSGFTTRAHLGQAGDFGGAGFDLSFLKTIRELLGKIGTWIGALGDSGWGKMMKQMLGSVMDKFRSWIGSKIGDVFGVVSDVKDSVVSIVKAGAKGLASFVGGLFDTGGVLKSGQFAFNASGKPERVLDPKTTQNFDQFTRALNTMVNRRGVQSVSRADDMGDGAGGVPRRVELVVEGHRFTAFLRDVADGAVSDAMSYADHRRSMGSKR